MNRRAAGTAGSAGDSNASGFVHPGLLHTAADFERMREKVDERASPWLEGWQRLINNNHASLTWKPDVVLSWWGTAYATSYTVKHSSKRGGPYTTLASDIVEPRTFTHHTPGAGAHYYVVSAQTPNGETAISNEARAYGATALHTLLTFDATSGTTAADASPNAHDAELRAEVTWQAGTRGNSVAFDSTTGYVALPKDLLLDVAGFTIVAWVYWTGTTANQRIFDFGTGIGEYLFLTPKSGAGEIAAFVGRCALNT